MMKKITAFILLIFCYSVTSAQVTNNTGITGDDLIYHEDGRQETDYDIVITGSATVATNGGTKPADDTEAGYTRPTNNVPGGDAADYTATLKTNNVGGGANEASTMWYVVKSVDLSTYDGGNKYFTIVTYSQYFENGSDNIDDQNEFWYRNSDTGDDPNAGAAWTKVTSGLISSHANGVLGKDATWVATKIDLSSITCGSNFALALKRTTSADGPNPGKTAFSGTDNRNGSFFVSSHLYTGTAPKTKVLDGDFSAFNTGNNVTQTSIFNTPTASIDDANFTNTGNYPNIFTATNSVPRLVNGDLAPAGEGYKFEVASNYNAIAVSEIRYKLANGTSNKGTVGGIAEESFWKVQGSNDDTTWDDLTGPIGMYSANSSPNTGTAILNTTKAYRYYRFVLASAWTPNQLYTALQEMDFTVAALWTGTTNNDWNTTTNWNTEAVATHKVIIPTGITNYPTIATGTTVTTSNITVESGASLIADGTATVAGNVTYKRNLTFTAGDLEGWHLVGSPVSGQTYDNDYVTGNNIASGTVAANRGIATYNNATSGWVYHQNGASSTFGTGAGYSMKTTKTRDVSFTGTLNTDDVDVTISTGAGTDFNLISNPFTSNVNAKTFLELAANSAKLSSETIWVWNPATKNYDAKLSGDVTPFQIAPGQGFFVSSSFAEGVSGDLTFVEANQSHQGTDTFLREVNNPEFVLNITDGDLNRYAKVRFNDKATKGFDNGFDGERFNGVANTLDVYTQLLENNQGKNYQIQSLPNADIASMVIPVGLKAAAGAAITFSATALNLPSDAKVILEDRNTNTFTDLSDANATYKVTLNTALNGIGRFYVHIANKALKVENVALENISIYKSDAATLRIVGLEQGQTNVKLFNVLGKQILNTSFNSNGIKNLSLPKLTKGVYIIQLSSDAGKVSKKIILE